MSHILDEYNKDLKKIDNHRKKWLMLSSIVFSIVIFIIIDHGQFEKNPVLWVISSFGLLISVVWWYWTMKIIKILVAHRIVENQILLDLQKDIHSIKEDIKNNWSKT